MKLGGSYVDEDSFGDRIGCLDHFADFEIYEKGRSENRGLRANRSGHSVGRHCLRQLVSQFDCAQNRLSSARRPLPCVRNPGILQGQSRLNPLYQREHDKRLSLCYTAFIA